jgi:hypothetical protein
MRAATHFRRENARKQNQKFIGFSLMKEGVGDDKYRLGEKNEWVVAAA